MPLHNRLVCKLVFAAISSSLLPVLASPSSWAQEIPSNAHSLSKKCVSDAGILLCTECRVQAGLAPILTPGNADWKIVPDQPHYENRNSSKPYVEVEDDDDKEQEEKKPKRSKKNSDRKKNPSGKQENHDSPMPPIVNPPFPPHSGMTVSPVPQPPMYQPAMMQPGLHFSPTHPETLELLQNINRTLKSIESLMRQEAERQQHRPNPNFAPQWNPQPQLHRPQQSQPYMNGPQSSQPPRYEDPNNPGLPRNDMPRNDGPNYPPNLSR